MINIDDLEKIMKVVEKFDVSHFEFQQGDSKVVVDKNVVGELLSNNVDREIVKPEIEQAANGIDKEINEEAEEEKQYIKAAFAGTFYSTKEQGEPPFVKLNDKIEQDTVVGLIEVMKLFNEIEAGINGTIVDILVKDGDFVEYGQPLFEIKK